MVLESMDWNWLSDAKLHEADKHQSPTLSKNHEVLISEAYIVWLSKKELGHREEDAICHWHDETS